MPNANLRPWKAATGYCDYEVEIDMINIAKEGAGVGPIKIPSSIG